MYTYILVHTTLNIALLVSLNNSQLVRKANEEKGTLKHINILQNDYKTRSNTHTTMKQKQQQILNQNATKKRKQGRRIN